MEKKNKENKKVSEKKIKLNINYLEFINYLSKNKVVVEMENKNKIEEIYSKIVNKRFSNLERVSNRVRREKLSKLFIGEIEKRKIDIKNYLEIDNKVREISKERKSNNYLSI